ncbi:MAG TPA: Fe2+-dependent dioxygenase [Pseudolabrys sp.]|nr:Fe2+-dependent dioxygenase [Pseudolabrys sp.]
MRLVIGNVLSADEVRTVRSALAKARFVDGRETAGFAARLVKHNRQAAARDHSLDTVRELIESRLRANDVFTMAARPKAFTPLLFSKTAPGMEYGTHIDDALMRGLRTDIAFTLFLYEPKSYGGGELVIEDHDGEDSYKLPAGTMIAYPATTLHRVNPVTRGTRIVCAGWARSFIRDAAQRELLFDLDTARRRLFARDGKSADFDLLSKSLSNLLRMWAED